MTEKGLQPIRRRPFFTEVQMPMRITNALLFVEGEFRPGSLTFEDGVLSLSVTRKAEEEEQQGQYLVRERSAGTAERRFAFPDADDAAIEAKLQDGVLTLRLPKKSKPGRQSIAVK